MKFIILSLMFFTILVNAGSNNNFDYLNSNYISSLKNFFIEFSKRKATIKSNIDESLFVSPTASEEPTYVNPLPKSEKLNINSFSFGYEQERLRSYLEVSTSGSKLKMYSLLFDYYFSKNDRLDFFIGSGLGYTDYKQTGFKSIDSNLSIDSINQNGYSIPLKLGLNFKINSNLSLRTGFSWSKILAPSRHTIDYHLDDQNSTLKSNIFLTSIREIYLSLELKF